MPARSFSGGGNKQIDIGTSDFFGSKPFSKTNEYLKVHGKKPIDWL